MRILRKAWKALEIAGAARDLATETRRFNWDVAPSATFFLQAEQARIRLRAREGREISATIKLQAGFGWQLITDQDEAGVYIIARRKHLIGSIGRARFDITLPADVHLSLKLAHCQVCLDDINTTLDFEPFA